VVLLPSVAAGFSPPVTGTPGGLKPTASLEEEINGALAAG
jgi:hypothetical protein